MQKLIQLLLEVLLGARFGEINSRQILNGDDRIKNKPCPGPVMLSCPSLRKPVDITEGSKVVEDCDGSSGATALRFSPLATTPIVFALLVIQPIATPEEPILGKARHLYDRKYRACGADDREKRTPDFRDTVRARSDPRHSEHSHR